MEIVRPTVHWLRKSAVHAVACVVTAILSHAAFAQSAISTGPIGFINLTVNAGTVSIPGLTVLSFPFLNDTTITGQATGVITGVTANSISNTSAGWTAGALSVPATPYLIQITSGSAAGLTFLISTTTANTSTTVTLDDQERRTQVDLTTLGIAAGVDSYAIYGCDTLLGVFGAGTAVATGTTVLGATSQTGADIVQMFVSGYWRQYYYNTTTGNWIRIGADSVSDNVPIRPDTGVIYSRAATLPLTLTITGSVPALNRQTAVANSGINFISSLWPVDMTLASSNIASLPGWVSSSSSDNADIIQLRVSGFWRQYYYDGTNWRRVGADTISDTVAIPVGSAFLLQKKGSATGVNTLVQTLPYSL